MSIENAKAFLEVVKADAELQKKLAGISEKEETLIIQAGLNIAKTAGYTFTAEDWKAALQERSAELSEQELEQVAGGGIVNRCMDITKTNGQFCTGGTKFS